MNPMWTAFVVLTTVGFVQGTEGMLTNKEVIPTPSVRQSDVGLERRLEVVSGRAPIMSNHLNSSRDTEES